MHRLSAEVRALRRRLQTAETPAGAGAGSSAITALSAQAHQREQCGRADVKSENLVLQGAETVARFLAAMLLMALLSGGELCGYAHCRKIKVRSRVRAGQVSERRPDGMRAVAPRCSAATADLLQLPQSKAPRCFVNVHTVNNSELLLRCS